MIIVINITSFMGCNTPYDSTTTDENSDIVTTESEISDNSLENTSVHILKEQLNNILSCSL